MFCFWLCTHAHTHTFILTHKHTCNKQSHKIPLEAQTARTHPMDITHSVKWPLRVCSLLWMVVIIFGHLARDRVTMETTKQWSCQQACYIIVKGEPVQGRQDGATLCEAGAPFLWLDLQVLATVSPLALRACLLVPFVCPASWCLSHMWPLCLSISFGLWPASVGCLGPGQTHPGVSIETADPGCEFLVLENPMWWL